MAGDRYWDYVSALLHFDGSDASTTFTDETGKTWTAKGNAQIDTANSVFGGASGLFDSSGDGITTPDSEAFNFGAGNFTLEWRVRFASVSGDYGLYGQHNNSSNADSSLIFRYSSSNGGLRLALYSGAAATTHNFTWSPSINTWYAIALVRNGSTVSCYIDGVKIGSDLTYSSTINNSTQVAALGCINGVLDFPLNGWLDETRITKGIARYTADFTVPTEAFPNYKEFTGTLVVTESGSDTAKFSTGTWGTLTVTESGSDTASISGTVPVSGTLSVSETGADACAVSGTALLVNYVGGKTYGWGNDSAAQTISLADLTGGLASSPREGDVVVVAYAVGSVSDEPIGVNTSGYTEVSEPYSNDSYDANLSVSYKVMGATPDTSVQVSGTGSTNNAGSVVIQVFRGVDITTPLDVSATTATGIDSGAANPASITPVTSRSVIVAAGAAAALTTGTFSAPYLNNFLSVTGADLTDAACGMGWVTWPGGTYDPAAWTGGSGSTAASWAAVTLVLRPLLGQNKLAATESGADTAAIAGQVVVHGSLAGNESNDTASISGTMSISGQLAASEAGDSATLLGTVPVQGTLSSTESGEDACAIAGTALAAVTGTLASTESSADSFAAAASLLVQGDWATSESGTDTIAAAGQVAIHGDLAAAEVGSDTAALSGAVPIAGDLAASESGSDGFVASGVTPNLGTLAASESGADTASFAGVVVVQGTSTAYEAGSDTCAASGAVAVQGALAATDSPDMASLSGAVLVRGVINALELADSAQFAGAILVKGGLATTEAANDTFAFTGTVQNTILDTSRVVVIPFEHRDAPTRREPARVYAIDDEHRVIVTPAERLRL